MPIISKTILLKELLEPVLVEGMLEWMNEQMDNGWVKR